MDYKKYYKKTKIERDYNIDGKESKLIDQSIYILLLLALFFVPLFIKAHLSEFISPNLTLLSTGVQADIFSYYKYIFLVILTILMGILFLYKVLFLQYDISKNTVNLFLGALAIIIILSAIFSPYKSLALHGMYNRHEGTISYICYLIIFFIAANTKFSSKQIHGLLYILYPFVIINVLLGLSLFNEKNPLEIGWINSFILASVPKEGQVNEGAQLWATVSNPNYISGIGSVLAVLFLTWAIFDKNKIRAGINVVVAILSFSMVLTSFSTSGFLTIIVLFPFIIILILLNKQKLKSFVIFIVFVILATSIYIPLANQNPRVWDETFGFVFEHNPFEKNQVSYRKVIRTNIETRKQYESLNLFKPIVVNAEEKGIEKFEIPKIPEASVSAGSGRAYIWEKTFNKAMERPLFGYGLDTFIYVFPQDDIDKVAGLGEYDVIVDKPHNMYLGLLIGSGVIALLFFILLVVSILKRSLCVIYSRKGLQVEKAIFLSLLTAFTAYLIQGLFNDSIIGAAVIFWVLAGVLVSIVYKYNVEGKN